MSTEKKTQTAYDRSILNKFLRCILMAFVFDLALSTLTHYSYTFVLVIRNTTFVFLFNINAHKIFALSVLYLLNLLYIIYPYNIDECRTVHSRHIQTRFISNGRGSINDLNSHDQLMPRSIDNRSSF